MTAVGQSEYCLDGTVWDDALQGCIVANPSDSNFDGCVQLADLLDLLGVYGTCGDCGEDAVWPMRLRRAWMVNASLNRATTASWITMGKPLMGAKAWRCFLGRAAMTWTSKATRIPPFKSMGSAGSLKTFETCLARTEMPLRGA